MGNNRGKSIGMDGSQSKASLGNQIQQKVAMNNFLTPIVFVSNNYHGVPLPANPNGEF